MFISHYNGHEIKLVRPLSTVDNTRDYARVSHSRQWSNYNIYDTTTVKPALNDRTNINYGNMSSHLILTTSITHFVF